MAADRPPLHFMGLNELRAYAPKRPRRVVETLIPSRGLVLVSGGVKTGKSLSTLSLLSSAAYGFPVFGRFEVPTPLKGLYITEEDDHDRMLAHAEAFLAGLGKDPDDPAVAQDFSERVHLAIRDKFTFDNKRTVKWLEKYIKRFKAKLVVFDALRRFSSADLMRDWSALNALAIQIRDLAVDCDCTICMIHHNHATRYRATVDDSAGGFGLRAEADHLWNLTGRSNDKRVLEVVSRDGLPHKFHLELDTVGPEDSPLRLEFSVTDVVAKKTRKDEPVLAYLRETNKPVLVPAIVKHTGLSAPTIYRRLADYRRTGTVIAGKHRNGKTYQIGPDDYMVDVGLEDDTP